MAENMEKISAKDFAVRFFRALPALLLPVIILGGIYSGMMTPTESASAATIYALIVGVFVYKEIKIKDLYMILLESGKAAR